MQSASRLSHEEQRIAREAISLILSDHQTAGWEPDRDVLLADGNYDLFMLNYFPNDFFYIDERGKAHPHFEPINYRLVDALEHESQMVGWLPGGTGKDLAATTPVLTTDGWKTMGTIEVGDTVFGADGKPTQVTGVSAFFLGNDCYELTFADGAKIVAGADHLWRVYDEYASEPGHRHGAWRIYSTREMAGKTWERKRGGVQVSHRFYVKSDAVIDQEPVELPIEPYVFGYWLGDGHSAGARITCANEDMAHVENAIEEAGYRVTSRARTNSARLLNFNMNHAARDGFMSRAKSLGVLDNKHIPEVYFRGSFEQRRALFAGLMDSDGSISVIDRNDPRRQPQTTAEFSVCNERLAHDVHSLLRSLGERATCRESDAKLDGKVVGKRYRINWRPSFNPFRLERKAAKYTPPSRKRDLISIRAIVPVSSVPTRCIQVDNAEHVYLAGNLFTPTHNSTTLRRWIIYVLCREPQISMIYVEKTDPTVRQVARSILSLLETNEALRKDFGEFKGDHWSTEAFTIRQRPEYCQWPTLAFYSAGGSAMLGKRCNICIVDDPVTSDNSSSELERARLLQWYNEQPATAPVPLPIGKTSYMRKLFLIGTTFHMDDLFHKVLERGGYTHLYLKAVDDDGEVLAPMRYCWREPKELAEAAEVNEADSRLQKRIKDGYVINLAEWKQHHGTSAFLKRYQNQIIDRETQSFPMEWFEGGTDDWAPPDGYPGCYDETRDLGAERVQEWTYVTGVDPAAGTKGPRTVRFACVTLGCNLKEDPNTVYLVDLDYGQQPLVSDNPGRESQTDIVLRHAKTYNSRIVLEKNNVQGAWAQVFRQEAQRRGQVIQLTAQWTGQANKVDPEQGIQAMAPMIENGYLRIPYRLTTDKRKVKQLVDEFVYKGVMGTDDIMMAFWFAWGMLERMKRVNRVVEPERRVIKPYMHRGDNWLLPDHWNDKQIDDFYRRQYGGPEEVEAVC